MRHLPKGNTVPVCDGNGTNRSVQPLPLGTVESRTQQGADMRALVESHAFVRRIEIRDLFRSAYIRRFNKDISQTSLDEDVDVFQKFGKVPPYIVDFMLAVYGAH